MEDAQSNGLTQTTTDKTFKSKLQEPAERFLVYAIEHSLKCGRRTAKDFVRHFPPATIMEGLDHESQLRANILVVATGVRMKVALKKSATSCGADLQIALDERETTAETIVSLFQPDDRVRFLDSQALWRFLTEGEFWLADAKKDPAGHAVAAQHISYLIDRALDEQLLTHRDVVQGITVANMTKLLPRSELPKIIDAALELGHSKQAFSEKSLIDSIGMATLLQHIPLPAIWTDLVVPFVAQPNNLAPLQPAPVVAVAHNPAPTAIAPSAPVASPKPAAPVAQVAAPAASKASPPQAAETGRVSVQAAFRPSRAPEPKATTPARSQESGIFAPSDSSLDLAVDDVLSNLVEANSAPKIKRPGSVPPGR